jgi:hypothetical protein
MLETQMAAILHGNKKISRQTAAFENKGRRFLFAGFGGQRHLQCWRRQAYKGNKTLWITRTAVLSLNR